MYFSLLGCDNGHENVTQVAEDDGNSAVKRKKRRREEEKKRRREEEKKKAGCWNLPQLADSVRLATPLARFGKVSRTAS